METSDRSVSTLLQDLATNVTNLVRDEIRLAQAEAGEKTNQVVMAVVSLLAGFLLAHAGLIILLLAVAVALGNFMPDWLASLIVGAVVTGIALALVMKGKNDLTATRLAPERTARNLQRDAELAREQTR